jgi:hypothetical protein
MDTAKWFTPFELAAWQRHELGGKDDLRVELPALQHGDPTKRNCYGTPFFAAFLSVACSLLRTLKAAEGETELARITATESQIITFSTDSNAGTASL